MSARDVVRAAKYQQIVDDIREYVAAAEQDGFTYVTVEHIKFLIAGRPEKDIVEDYEGGAR